MTHDTLSRTRKSIYPQIEDTWQLIAARELGGQPETQATELLQSWNLHVFMRPGAKSGNPILPSDIIFLEPPLT